ncbi:iron-containing alcohol dehydrogenase [Altericroceibacterium endophyticum]|uniref:Alcohol dehydrogenase 2 n=1 Tax=Altericroceibacterium endophyticum TaxID=1808508 RepID=A0A6I4T9Y2_9SPHN|nr:iron-containing alcohol dehydrogenase [Altericroceibacterium endophyticum]
MGNRNRLDLYHARCVRIGAGVLAQCALDCAATGARRVLIVTSAPIARLADELSEHLAEQGLTSTLFKGPDGEPTRADLSAALTSAQDFGADFIIGLGGGSAMDVAKLVAALFGERQTFDEVVGTGLLAGRALPLACIPTTAGTGSEVTPIAILEDEAAQLKKGVVSPFLIPDFAYLDPQLTVTMPRKVTASTGIDALTHCIEAYANRLAHPVVDSWALEGIRLIGENLEIACNEPDNLSARENMLIASHLGGMCLGPVNTAAVHALAYPMGGEFHVPHGVANSLLLPHVIRFNAEEAPERYARVAHMLGVADSGDAARDAAAGIARIEDLSAGVGIDRRLRDVGISSNALPGMAAAAMTVQRLLQNNPREMNEEQALRIYEAAL